MEKREWELGYNQGYNIGFEDGYAQGYIQGVNLGHNNGFMAALEEAEEKQEQTAPLWLLQNLTSAGLVEIVVWGAAANKAIELFEQLGIKVRIERP